TGSTTSTRRARRRSSRPGSSRIARRCSTRARRSGSRRTVSWKDRRRCRADVPRRRHPRRSRGSAGAESAGCYGRTTMESTITEIAPDTFRISTFRPDYGIQFNQFLIRDAEPFLMHTGFRKMFDTTLAAVRTLIDPATLRWIGYSHFEPDECGALNELLAV